MPHMHPTASSNCSKQFDRVPIWFQAPSCGSLGASELRLSGPPQTRRIFWKSSGALTLSFISPSEADAIAPALRSPQKTLPTSLFIRSHMEAVSRLGGSNRLAWGEGTRSERKKEGVPRQRELEARLILRCESTFFEI